MDTQETIIVAIVVVLIGLFVSIFLYNAIDSVIKTWNDLCNEWKEVFNHRK